MSDMVSDQPGETGRLVRQGRLPRVRWARGRSSGRHGSRTTAAGSATGRHARLASIVSASVVILLH
jgi:hypothetical protein